MAFIDELLDDPMIADALRREAMGPPEDPGFSSRREAMGPPEAPGFSPMERGYSPMDGGYSPASPEGGPPVPRPAAPPPDIDTIAGMQRPQSRIDPTVGGMRQYTPPQTPDTGDYTLLVGDRPQNHIPDQVRHMNPYGDSGGNNGGGFGSRLKHAIPGILAGAIAGGATPNQAAGGPMDIFRAMQAGGADVDRRTAYADNQARQRLYDEMKRREDESMIADRASQARMRDMQTEYYRAQANAKGEVTPEHDLYNQWMRAQDPIEKKALWDKLQEFKHGVTKPVMPFRTRNGVTTNLQTGETWEDDPEAARAARVADVRLRHVGMSNPHLWSDAAVIQNATPDEQWYITTGKKPTPEKQPGNMNLIELANLAANEADPHGPYHTAIALAHPPKEPRPQSAAELKHEDLKAAATQADLIWQGTLDWLQKNGKATDPETVLSVAHANATNPQYFPDQDNVGYVGEALRKIAANGGRLKKTLTGTADTGAAARVKARLGGTGTGTAPGGPAPQPVKPLANGGKYPSSKIAGFAQANHIATIAEARRKLESLGWQIVEE